ncbi:hypothetical protein OB919_01265 [Halobacteria archaeon AArc-curdl1]|uniref:Uncharacterized protein n=1 Tax=Natronosalvus hydrolyticus TaxID=2979988 RepID=A0AAP2Z4T5_9EURY|nr:hypothetical protein [Halobacteria archaeon AArc-curdl1]
MHPTTEGTFRVYPGRSADEWLLLEVNAADPTYVASEDVDGELEVGNRLEGTVEWVDDTPQLAEFAVEDSTRFHFVRTDAPTFQAAQTCFDEARQAGEAMNASVTRDTDGRPNGVLYTFAEQAGQRDLFAEFRDGEKPLEPLLARATESASPPFSVWVLDVSEPFVLVTIVLNPDGLFEETMRETYLEGEAKS